MDKLQQLSKNLIKRGFNAEIFYDHSYLTEKVYNLINGYTVGYGSSMSLKQTGVLEKLHEYAKMIYPHLPGEAGINERNALTSDFYLTSANAVSMDGHIVNIDGTGNRVAATCFGPKNVIYLIGKNKIADTLNDAMIRAKDTAVKLAKHFNRKTPCVKTGKCEDCLSSECICSVTTIHRKKPYGVNISVFLINEELGL